MLTRTINRNEINWENSTQVISSAQKFILPIPKLENGEDAGLL